MTVHNRLLPSVEKVWSAELVEKYRQYLLLEIGYLASHIQLEPKQSGACELRGCSPCAQLVLSGSIHAFQHSHEMIDFLT